MHDASIAITGPDAQSGDRGGLPVACVRALQRTGSIVAAAFVVPFLISFHVRAHVLGRDRALEGSTQALALVPGVLGQYLRRAFLSRVLRRFDRTATVEFGTIFSTTGAEVDEDVYIGPGCRLGLVHLERDVLLAPNVQIPSGPAVHGTREIARSIREQPGRRRLVTVGAGSWIGAGAVVLANVGRDSVVGACAVVTRPVPDRVVAGGVPARVIRSRESVDEARA